MNKEHKDCNWCPCCDSDECYCTCEIDDDESETSVARGLGFRIDDDGEWVPYDDNIIW